MKYLLHHSDSVYDDTTKRWQFTLDKRIGNPIHIKISKLSFTAAVAATYPAVVYIRSDALHKMARVKHSVELKSADHENASNVIAVLQETHTLGRYKLHEPVFLPVHPNSYHSRALDLYFTDGSTVLDGGVSTGEPESTNITDQNILDITDLIFFLDWDHAASIDPNPISQNEDITSITSRLSPNNYVFATTGNGIVYSSFGETNSMLSTVANKYALDSTTQGNVDEGSTACLTMMFRTKDVLASWAWIFKSPLFQITVGEPLDSISNMGYYDADSSLWGYTSLVIEGGTDYLLQIKKSSNTFDWLLRNLTTNAEQTESTTDTASTGTANAAFYLSNAQSGFNGLKISHVIEFLSVTEADCLAVKNWMLQKYTGEDVEGEVGDASNNATFFVEMNIKTRNVGR